MTSPLVLSLFPGIGLLDRAFEEEGFCIVRGPDLLWGGDVRRFHPPPGRFEGIIGGPPCQAFSRLRYLVEANGYQTAPNLIPEFERCVVEAEPWWFLMENVPAAPVPMVRRYSVQSFVFNNRWCTDAPDQNRLRRFSFGSQMGWQIHPEVGLFESPDYVPAVLAHGGDEYPVKIGGSGKVKRTIRAAALGRQTAAYFEHSKAAQGVPPEWDLPGFTVHGKIRALNNGVPLPMGRAIARAVKRALDIDTASEVAE